MKSATQLPSDESIHVQRFAVEYEYPVVFTEHALRPENLALRTVVERNRRARSRMAVVVDRGVADHWPGLGDDLARYVAAHSDALELTDDLRTVIGGEASKNDPALLADLHRWFFELGLDRHAVIVAIGGGAMLDLVGFAAATAHRGIGLVRMPTTVLGQNDAGIGVKNGINAFRQKNGIGSFQTPLGVINDSAFLTTLPRRDRLAGMAEAIKVALIRDAGFFAWLCESRHALAALEPRATREMIHRCARLHLAHIATSGDPFERGSARPLDYGHWAAHKLELLTGHELRHGEAVAIGIALDTRYAVERGMLDERSGRAVIDLVRALGLAIWHAALDLRDETGARVLTRGLDEFRQHLGGALCIPMLTAIGSVREVDTIDLVALDRACEWLRVHG